MAGRPGRRRLDHTSPLVDLDAVFADDALIDSIVARPFAPTAENRFTVARRPELTGAGRHRRDPIDDLFASWRQELAEVPIPAAPSVRQAAVAVTQPVPRRNRSMRSVMSVAAAIAALLIGSTTVGAKDAAPDSPLWGITTVLWPDRAESVASRSTVREALDDARSALDAGNDQDAQLALLRANAELGNIAAIDGREDMQQLVADMWVEATRDTPPSISPSAATKPPASAVASTAPTTPPTSGPQVLAAAAAAPAVAADLGGVASTGESAGSASSFDFGAVASVAPSPSQATTPEQSGAGSTSPDPSTSPPSPTSSSDSPANQPPSTQPPSTLPPPSVPIAPITPAPTVSESTAPTAPAQSAPVPTPSPSSSPATEQAPPVDSSAVSSANDADHQTVALTGP